MLVDLMVLSFFVTVNVLIFAVYLILLFSLLPEERGKLYPRNYIFTLPSPLTEHYYDGFGNFE